MACWGTRPLGLTRQYDLRVSYEESAELYDIIYAKRKDYAKESALIEQIVASEIGQVSGTLLDIGCGTGLHALHLAKSFEVEGVDLSLEMLRFARKRLASAQFHQGDMRSFDLGKTYDVVVSLFGAVGHLRSLDELRKFAAQVKKHMKPKSVVIIEPWYLPGHWQPGPAETNFIPDERVLRVVESSAEGRIARLAMHYFIGWPDAVSYFRADHELTSWSTDEFQTVFAAVGIDLRFTKAGLTSRGLFIGRIRIPS